MITSGTVLLLSGFIQAGFSVPEQLQQVVAGDDQVPLAIHLLQTSQQEAPQAAGFLDLTVHRLHDRLLLGRSLRLALGVDR